MIVDRLDATMPALQFIAKLFAWKITSRVGEDNSEEL